MLEQHTGLLTLANSNTSPLLANIAILHKQQQSFLQDVWKIQILHESTSMNTELVSYTLQYFMIVVYWSVVNEKEERWSEVKNFKCTHSNNSFAKAEGTTTAILCLILRLVVAQGVVFQDHPTVLPSMDVICPLKNKAQLQCNQI